MAPRCRYLLLILCIPLISAKTTFTPLTNDSSSSEVQGRLSRAQVAIIRQQTDAIIADSLSDLKDRLNALENIIKKIMQSPVDRKPAEEECGESHTNSPNPNDTVGIRLKCFQSDIEKYFQRIDKNNLFKEIVDDIRSTRFKIANEKLIRLDDLSAIGRIVHEVYANSEDNFGLILNFSVVVSDESYSFRILQSLHDEIEANDHKEPLKLIILARTVDNKIKHNTCASDLRSVIVSQIKTSATEQLIESMKFGDFSRNEDIRHLLEGLYDFDPTVSDEVMQKLVNGTYGVVESRAVLAHIFVQCNTPQAILGINSIFWKVKNEGHLNDSVLVLDIASNLSDLRKKKDFDGISQDLKNSFDKVVQSIPLCARNLFFESSVCLWNKAKKAYIQATNTSFNFDKQRRRVFTSELESSSHIPEGAAWLVEKSGDSILFKSKDYTNEYFYVAAIDYNHEMRYVFTWIEGGNKDKQSAFKVELLDDDVCLLQSVFFNEYIYVSDVKYKKDTNYSYVFSWKPGSAGGADSDFVWQIRAC